MPTPPLFASWLHAALCLLAVVAGRCPADQTLVLSRLDHYTTQTHVQVVVVLDARHAGANQTLTLRHGNRVIATAEAGDARRPSILTFAVDDMPVGASTLTVALRRDEREVASWPVTVTRLAAAANDVAVDRLVGGLIVDGLPTLAVGFYTYFPVDAALIHREATNGFSVISPYHDGMADAVIGVTDDERLAQIRAYMDQAAAAGMKVHYQLINKAKLPESPRKWQAIEREVMMFRDHPALLAWYIADEPIPSAVSPADMEATHRFIKERDPYHPITIVFNNVHAAKAYERAMDVVMVDPYPVPNQSLLEVERMVRPLVEQFRYRKPVWCVPQAFGGGESWQREPTPAEARVMTYLSVINGATGIQYFIRSGLNSFPKSPLTWAACSQMAMELQELTPLLLSSPEADRPRVTTSNAAVRAAAWRVARGRVLILAANTQNVPAVVTFNLDDARSAKAAVLFENRSVDVRGGIIEEPIAAHGTIAYLLPAATDEQGDSPINPHNVLLDPGFESQPTVGTPAHFYVSASDGATCMIDSRTAFEGEHSLRLTVPPEGRLTLDAFPVSLRPHQTYRVRLRARTLRPGMSLQIGVWGEPVHTFTLDDAWRTCEFTIPPADRRRDIGPRVAVVAAGTIWIDALECFPELIITAAQTVFLDQLDVTAHAAEPGGLLRYTLDGTSPTAASPQVPHDGRIILRDSATLRVARFDGVDDAGRSTARASFEKLTPLPPVVDNDVTAGLVYAYYEDPGQDSEYWSRLPDFAQLTPVVRGDATTFTHDVARRTARYALQWTGYIKAPADGLYTFIVRSDDGARLSIADQRIVDHDGQHGMTEARGSVALKAGLHPIRLDYFQGDRGRGLLVAWEGPDLARQPVPASVLFRPEKPMP